LDRFQITGCLLKEFRVLTKISAHVTVPLPDKSFDGIFTITTELSPMASPAFEVNRPSQTELLLSRLLEKTIRRSQSLDTESLCLLAGQKVWSIRADVHVLSHDGNLVDAASIGVIAALQHFRKPDASVEGDRVTVWTLREREPVPLSLLHFPLCVTFSFYDLAFGKEGSEIDDNLKVLLDPTLSEEQMRDGSCTIGMNRHGEVCQIAKLGGVPVDAVALLNCVAVAGLKVKEISEFIKLRLEEDKKKRDKGGWMEELRADNDRVS
jgi:exosome complex component RRP45